MRIPPTSQRPAEGDVMLIGKMMISPHLEDTNRVSKLRRESERCKGPGNWSYYSSLSLTLDKRHLKRQQTHCLLQMRSNQGVSSLALKRKPFKSEVSQFITCCQVQYRGALEIKRKPQWKNWYQTF